MNIVIFGLMLLLAFVNLDDKPFLPENLAPITLDNAANLQMVGMFGRGTIEKVVWSPDEKHIATAGSAGIWIYNAENIEDEPFLLNDHATFVHDLAYNPSGSLLASASGDRTLRIWNTQTWEAEDALCLVGYDTPEAGTCSFIYSVAFNDDGSFLAAVLNDYIVIWDVNRGEIKYKFFEDDVSSVRFVPGQHWLATLKRGWESTIKIWDFMNNSDQPRLEINEFPFPLSDFALSKDGNWVAVAGYGFEGVQTFDISNGDPVTTLPISFGNAVAIQPQMKLLATSGLGHSPDGVSPLWQLSIADAQTGNLVDRYDVSNFLSSISYSPSGDRIAAATGNGDLFLIDRNKQLHRTLGRGYYYWDTTFSTDGKLLGDITGLMWMNAGGDGGIDGGNIVSVWSLETGEEIANYTTGFARLKQIEFLPDLHQIIFNDVDQSSPFVWDLNDDPAQLLPEKRPFSSVEHMSLSLDGKLIAIVGSTDYEEGLFIYDFSTAGKQTLLTTHTDRWQDRIENTIFSPDSKLLATLTHDNLITIWDTASQKPVASRHSGDVIDMSFAPNGNDLIISQSYELIRWDWHDDESSTLFSNRDVYVGRIIFSRSGDTIITTSVNEIVVLDISSDLQPIIIPAHSGSIMDIELNQDGTLVATSSIDGTIRLWGVPLSND